MTRSHLSGVENGPGSSDGAPPDSLRELVLQAGLELLDRDGLSLTFESISYAKVFDYLLREYDVTVTRGSVHERIWASQNDFRRDVLVESVAYFPTGSVSEAILACAAAIEEPAGFGKDFGCSALLDLIRSKMFGRFQSVKALASLLDDPIGTETLHQLLNERAEQAAADARAQFPATLAYLGLRQKEGYGLSAVDAMDLCCGLIANLVEGGQLNYHAGSHDITQPTEFMSVSADADEPWHVLSVGIKSILDFFYVPEHRSAPAIDPVPPSRPFKVPTVDNHLARSSSSRRPRAQLRELVLAAAVELLLRDGAKLKPELLNYSSVFAHLKQTRGITVHRSSVHPRIWVNNDEYRHDVLARSVAANSFPVAVVSKTLEALTPALRPDGTVHGSRSAHELFRIGAAALSTGNVRAVTFQRLLQIKAALVDQYESEARTTLRAAVAKAERQRMEGNKVELQALVLSHGFRVRPETGLTEEQTLELFQKLNMTTSAGVIFNFMAGISAATRVYSLTDSEPGGTTEDWTPLGVAARAYFDQLYEPVN